MVIPDAVIAGVIGAAVSQVGAFGILSVTLRAQAARAKEEREFRERQERDADRRAVRDEKRERLRQAYVKVVAASLGMGQVVREYTVISRSGPAHDASLDAVLAEAFTDINRARAELMIETEGREVLETFDNVVVDAFTSFRQGLAANAASPGSVMAVELKTHRDDLQSGLDALIKSARTRLSLLEQALPG